MAGRWCAPGRLVVLLATKVGSASSSTFFGEDRALATVDPVILALLGATPTSAAMAVPTPKIPAPGNDCAHTGTAWIKISF